MFINKIKLSVVFLLILSAISCHKDIVAPVQTCNTTIEHNNDSHPKAAIFQEILDRNVKKGLPGMVMIVETPDNGKWVGASGFARLETSELMQPCHIFHSASVAKTYHAVAALSLVDEGKLDLDATIDTYLPDWVCNDLANRNTATVRQLMNHKSGIPDFIEDSRHILDYFNNLMHEFTTEEYLEYICGDAAWFKPGEDIVYSNTNTVLLALIMDNIAGNHADVITDNIINKLGLTQTFYKNEIGYPAPDGVVNTYVDMKGDHILVNSTEIERNFAQMSIGHDGMLASTDDYFKFIKALFNGELLSQSSFDEMTEFHERSEKRGFGLGLEITKSTEGDFRRIGHEGGSLGAANLVYHFPEVETTIVICSNFGNFLGGPTGEIFTETLIEVQTSLFE